MTIFDIFETPNAPLWGTPRNFDVSSTVCSPYVLTQDVFTPEHPYANLSTSTPLKSSLFEVSSYYAERATTISLEPQPKVVMQALDKEGSRILQKSLSNAPPDAIGGIVEEILPFMQTLMCDTYANYMCQQLFQVTNSGHRLKLLAAL